jgi:hypothetical protein
MITAIWRWLVSVWNGPTSFDEWYEAKMASFGKMLARNPKSDKPIDWTDEK